MGYSIKQGQTTQPLVFLLVDATDHITGKTGLTPVVTLSKNGGAFAAPIGTISEVGNGWYKVAGNATDQNTLGSLVLHATGAGADPVDEQFHVVAFDPLVTSLGLVLAKDTNMTGLNDIAATEIVSGGAVTTLGGKVSGVATVDTLAGYVAPDNASVAAIKAKTDNLPASPAATGSAMTLADGSITTAAFAAGSTLPRVTLVDTCTTNTDMRGTDDAALAQFALSKSIWTPEKAAWIDGAISEVFTAAAGARDAAESLVTPVATISDTLDAINTAVGAIDGGITGADVQAALTAQGLTVARADKLDRLDADVSSISGGGESTATIDQIASDVGSIKSTVDNLSTSMIQPDSGVVTAGISPTATKFAATGDTLNPSSGFYTAGEFTMALYFTSGANAGKSVKITDHLLSGATHLFTVSPLPAPPATGDTFLVLGILPT